jgi:hypothetical protein
MFDREGIPQTIFLGAKYRLRADLPPRQRDGRGFRWDDFRRGNIVCIQSVEKIPLPGSIEDDRLEPLAAPSEPPRPGVELVTYEDCDGVRYYTVRDLRNGNMVKNVTLALARRLWHYAIVENDKLPPPEAVTWQGDLAMIKKRSRRGESRYDLYQSTPSSIRYYYGISEDGIHGKWKKLVGAEEKKRNDAPANRLAS